MAANSQPTRKTGLTQQPRDEAPRKTASGADEVRSRSLGLGRVRRQILIAANGRYSIGELERIAASIGGHADDVQALLNDGLIETGRPADPPADAAQAENGAPRRSLALAKLHLLETCPRIFGNDAMARELLATAHDTRQLKAALAVLQELAARRNAQSVFAAIHQVALDLLPQL